MDNNAVMPDLLNKIIEWQDEVAPEVPYLETPTGYFLQFDPMDNGGYTCSPLDAIMFARTGMDGIHYSLLTDFGTVAYLNEAPVICVSPMDFGHCIRIVADNIHDFFALHFWGHEDLLMNDFKTKEEYLRHRLQQEEETSEYFDLEKWNREKAFVREKAVEKFKFMPIEDAFEYVQKVRSKREKQIVLKTADGLGIVPLKKGGTGSFPSHPWYMQEIPLHELDGMKAFIDNAEAETLLSFIRDCQEQGAINAELMQLLQMGLERHGFYRESKRLLQCMHVLIHYNLNMSDR